MSFITRFAHDWAKKVFGREYVERIPTGALRSLEEQAELAQACDVPEEIALKCIRTVYSRPVGDKAQEIGGVLLTTAILCESLYLDFDECLQDELRRVLQKSEAHFAKRNQEKVNLGLNVSGPDGGHDDSRRNEVHG